MTQTNYTKKSNIGLIGLAVMGENLALNLERHGWEVSVYNRTVVGVEEGVVERFISGRAKDKSIIGYTDIRDFVQSLETPRKIMMMIRAGKPIDELIEQLLPLLSSGDILIDGGNSNFKDTERRIKYIESKGMRFIGSGVSGGEEGALQGASIMPGGSVSAWPEIKPILQSIAAKADDGTPCCEWIGTGGSGHFVKMIHNGIEYGDIQLICEAYSLMKNMLHLSNEAIATYFEQWNKTKLKSYLIEITAHIFKQKEADGSYLIDKILDTAGQKGTGKWSVINSMELGMPLNLIATAVFERNLSTLLDLRIEASNRFKRHVPEHHFNEDTTMEQIYHTLYASKIISYAQGFNVLKQASEKFEWKLDMASIARMWRGGCIIRSSFLDNIADAFIKSPTLNNLLLDDFFHSEIEEALPYWKKLVATATMEEIGIPAFSSALNYFYSLTTRRLPANLLQAQRDYFGAHTFERIDRKRGEFFHENWTGHGGDTSSGSYNA